MGLAFLTSILLVVSHRVSGVTRSYSSKTIIMFFVHMCSGSLVINTWTGDFSEATKTAFATLSAGGSILEAVEDGCNTCEALQCDGTVGYGGRPDTSGETTLDAMIMYGPTHSVGAVGYLRRVKAAISVARAVMEHSAHTLLVGEGATDFASMLGFPIETLSTQASELMYAEWIDNSCQPNYYRNFLHDTEQCPPYAPDVPTLRREHDEIERPAVGDGNHDTIGMVVIDEHGDIACGTTTNGAGHKINGRVGDSPIAGAGCYVDNLVGGAAATGDGDIMMRFLPSFRAVEHMRQGLNPDDACLASLCSIIEFYPTFGGALICANKEGDFGAARHLLPTFRYSYRVPGANNEVMIGDAVEVTPETCAQMTKVMRRKIRE